MKPLLLAGSIVLHLLFMSDVNGGQRSVTEQQRFRGEGQTGRIAGQVVSEDGQRLSFVEVTAVGVGRSRQGRFVDGTDENGNFEFTELPVGAYALSVRAPGFVSRRQSSESRYHRTGEAVTLTIVRGGVITGTVKNASGEGLPHVPVQAIRVAAPGEDRFDAIDVNRRIRRTDDRGAYRLYGLEPGTYIVCAGGGDLVAPRGFSKYADDSPTFYPSVTRGGASELKIQSGEELSGIDITYRGQQGHSVRGLVSGKMPQDRNTGVSIALLDAATGTIQSFLQYPLRADTPFVFRGVADGVYFVSARAFSSNPRENGIAQPKEVTVRGTDVLGLNLPLMPMGSISGRVVLLAREGALPQACEEDRKPSLEEVVISLQRQPTPATRTLERSTSNAGPDNQGVYTIYDLTAGLYAISASLPSSNWFVKSVSLKKGHSSGSKLPESNDVTFDGIEVHSAMDITGLDFLIGTGAAAVSGRVTSPPGSLLPSQLNAYLVSNEASNNSNFRLYQTRVHDNGEFEFSNAAPGKYWLLLRAFSDGAAANRALRFSTLDPQARALLRKQANAANTLLDLKGCQRVSGYSIRYVGSIKN